MASLTYAGAGGEVRTGSRIAGRLRAAYARIAAARRARRDLRMLIESSDHILDDIGVVRADLERALAAPLWVDPSHRLPRRGR